MPSQQDNGTLPQKMNTTPAHYSKTMPRYELPNSFVGKTSASQHPSSFEIDGSNPYHLYGSDMAAFNNMGTVMGHNNQEPTHHSNSQARQGYSWDTTIPMAASQSGLQIFKTMGTPTMQPHNSHNPGSTQPILRESPASGKATISRATRFVHLQDHEEATPMLSNKTFISPSQIYGSQSDGGNLTPQSQGRAIAIDGANPALSKKTFISSGRVDSPNSGNGNIAQQIHSQAYTTDKANVSNENLWNSNRILFLERQELRSVVQRQQGYLQKARKDNQLFINQVQELQRLLQKTTEEVERWKGDALKMSQHIRLLQQPRPTNRMLVRALSSKGNPSFPMKPMTLATPQQILGPTFPPGSGASLADQPSSPVTSTYNNPLAFVKTPRPNQAYLTPPIESPQYANKVLPNLSINSVTASEGIIDLTLDELETEPPKTQTTASTAGTIVAPASKEASIHYSREHYVVAMEPNLVGPSKMPHWALQAKIDMEAKLNVKAASTMDSATDKRGRKAKGGERPAKRAKTQQTAKTTKTYPGKSKKDSVKKSIAPCKPKTSAVAEVESTQSATPAISAAQEEDLVFEQELQAMLEAELEAMAEKEAINSTSNGREEPGMNAYIDPALSAIGRNTADQAASKEADAVAVRPASPTDSLFDGDGEDILGILDDSGLSADDTPRKKTTYGRESTIEDESGEHVHDSEDLDKNA